VKVGAPLAIIGTADEDISGLMATSPAVPAPAAHGATAPVPAPAAAEAAPVPAQAQPVVIPTGRIRISPLAKKIAEGKNIDVTLVAGSGPGGRIVKKDVESFTAPAAAPAAAVRAIVSGETKEIPLTLMRKTIAKRLVESKVTAPHFYLTVEADMKPAVAFRASLNTGSDVKISFNDIIVKAAALALRRHPDVNATFTAEKIIQYGAVHVGVAVAIDDGLITPVLRNTDLKGLAEISAETKELAARAREKKLKPEEFTGGTFTISNLGMYDVENFAAIINPPEGAILAIGSIVEKPVVESGAIVVGQRMKMTLSCDHRVVDGATGARFMQTLKKILEHPAMLAL
jgi:pyruvate dehydrogenase E2 component (dihydrolipoamide acetyltransferase)